MFFRELEAFANAQKSARALIEKVDAALAPFRAGATIDPPLLSAGTGGDKTQVIAILQYLCEQGVVRALAVARCPNCGTLNTSRDDSATLEGIECSNCGHTVPISESTAEGVFVMVKPLAPAKEDAPDSKTSPSGPKTSSEPRIALVLVHGIRTNANWMEMVRARFAEHDNVDVVPVRYDFFDCIKFLLPGVTRRYPVERLARELRNVRAADHVRPICVIAHSFGCYALAKVLDNESDIVVERVILAGSVIPTNFRWDKVRPRVKREIINECGDRDWWPVLAKFSTFGYGPSGSFGFGTYGVRDRFHDFGHSTYFDPQFVDEFWVPYIAYGHVTASEYEANRRAAGWVKSILTVVKLPWIIVAIVIWCIWWWR